jgi:putative ABC transport system permease protein
MLSSTLKIAFGSLLASRTRTALTTIGITIGVASILLIFAAGEGARQKASSNVATIPASTAMLAPVSSVTTGSSPFDPLAIHSAPLFDQHDLDSLKNSHLSSAASPIMEVGGTVAYHNKPDTTAFIVGTSSNLFALLSLTYADGSDFGDDSTSSVVLGNELAMSLFGTQLASGKTLTIHGDTYTVTGVLADSGLPVNVSGAPVNTSAFITVGAAAAYTSGYTGFSRIFVHAPRADYAKISSLLTQNRHGQTDFAITQPSTSKANDSQLLTVLVDVTAVTSGLSLIIGGIGIMNIMLVNVSERTREIGIRKSIGASNGTILAQFLIEAAVMSVAGGILGTLLGIAIGVVAGLFLPFGLLFTPTAVLSVLGVSLLIGIIFGLFPAIRAARKDTIEALRYYQ